MAETQIALPPEIKRTILFRQLAFLIGVAASVALGVYVVIWSQTPNYSLLYGSLSDKDVGQVLEVLQKSGINFKVDQTSGAVMVQSSRVYDARMKLAAENLPNGAHAGFSILQEEQKLGTSQFIERARYQHALEEELVKTIEKISAVRSARIHLAIPKQTIFLRDRKKPSASVMLDIYSGHKLEEDKVAAIANLVAAGVPDLESSQVSIVDQYGRLMTKGDTSKELMLSNNQFQYAQRVQDSYIKRIEDILTPIVGADGVKAQVSAEFDFTSTEQTRETYNPDLPALRSEQVEEESQSGVLANGGVPGALSNQPPANAVAPEVAAGGAVAQSNSSRSGSTQRRSTRNFELDKTISHTRLPVGTLRRLSVAVLVDHKRVFDKSGNISYLEHSPEEIEQINNLVKEAIGFNTIRGDTVNVMNAAFTRPEPIEPLPEEPIWQQAWLWDIVKQVLGGAVVLFLVFVVLRPAVNNLMNKEINLQQALLSSMPAVAGALPPGQEYDEKTGEQIKAISGYDNSLAQVKGVVSADPKLAAQVVKNWVGDD